MHWSQIGWYLRFQWAGGGLEGFDYNTPACFSLFDTFDCGLDRAQ